MLSLVSYYLQCRTRYLGQCEEIERNCTRLQNFDICFCVLFNCCCCCWNITSGREIEHRALPKPKLDIFLIFPNFYWSKVLSCLIYGGRDGKLCWNWTKIRKLGCQNLFIIKNFLFWLVSYYLQCRKGYFGQLEETGWNFARLQDFDICFCVLFSCCCWNIISGGGIGHRTLPKPKLEIFLIFPNFYWSKVLNCSAACNVTCVQACYTRYHNPFYLWAIERVPKRSKVWKY